MWTILGGVLVLVLLYVILKEDNYFKDYGIPHLKPLPILGNMGGTFTRRISFFDLIQKIYDLNRNAKYVGVHDFNTPIIMIRDRELGKIITVKSFDHFVNHRKFIDPNLDPLFGNLIFSLKDDHWRRIRNLISPAFTSSKMKAAFKLIADCASNYADYFAEESRLKPLECNTKDAFTRYTNDVIGTFAFGVSIDSIRNRENEFYILGKKSTSFEGMAMVRLTLMRFVPRFCKLFNIKFATDDVRHFFTNLVKETIAMRDEKGVSRPDLIQLMMETRNDKDGKKLSVLEMTSQAYGFFFAGFDTSSTLMCFVAQEIAEKSHVQEKLQREVDEVFEEHQGDPPYEAINNMVYLDAVINEALRMYPVAPFQDRLCNSEFELPPALPGEKPLVLKPGDVVWLPIYCIHRDPEYFDNPEVFDPERFVKGDKSSAFAVNSMTFGQGPRACIGNRFAILETKILFAYLLRKCRLTPGSKMITPMRISKSSFIMKAEGGFWVEFQPRSQESESQH
ncbi:cytochrome P450 9e2-like [Fopius arisanus]|uniref:Cytochrome P450 9e2-like n=2 Tax=Fopius arisanus TaxID=64838 RepID=A0A9R1T6A0_9HYME|nr:PREDICTED: cytochrome P450 9e2-like [Fopius arisanus]